MPILYDKNEKTQNKWHVYSSDMPEIRGIGDTWSEALHNLTEKLNAIRKSVEEGIKRLDAED